MEDDSAGKGYDSVVDAAGNGESDEAARVGVGEEAE